MKPEFTFLTFKYNSVDVQWLLKLAFDVNEMFLRYFLVYRWGQKNMSFRHHWIFLNSSTMINYFQFNFPFLARFWLKLILFYKKISLQNKISALFKQALICWKLFDFLFFLMMTNILKIITIKHQLHSTQVSLKKYFCYIDDDARVQNKYTFMYVLRSLHSQMDTWFVHLN